MKFKTIILAWVALIPICAWSWGSADTGFRSGTVLEVIDTSNYTYLKIEEADATSWLATPTMAVQAGDLVRFSGGMEMGAFHSTELDREFDGILFIGDIEILKPGDFTHHADGVAGPAAEDAPDIPAPLAGEIQPLEGGLNIEGILDASRQFEGQPVRLRARIMKVNSNIMGKNWIVLADGSQGEAADTLLATSAHSPLAGELVIVEGVIRNNVSLGYGYEYEVLLEDASFKPADSAR